jgi:hypothetical protein
MKAGLLCHCAVDSDGHEPGVDECLNFVKSQAYPPINSWPLNATHQTSVNSTMVADLYGALAEAATTSAQRDRFRTARAIATSAAREHRAQEARTDERQHALRLANAGLNK